MRIWFLVLLFSSSFVLAGVEVRQDKMSANVNSEPLRGIVANLKQQSGITVTLDDSVAAERVTANFKDLPIAAGIKKMLEGTGINYAVLAEGAGKPTAVFIGSSEKPGAPTKKLDARPVVNRGVVTPLTPPIPQVQQPQPQQTPIPQTGGAMQNGTVGTGGVQPFGAVTGGGMVTPSNPVTNTTTPQSRSTPTKPGTTNVPTAGGFVPNINQAQPVQQRQQEIRPGNVVVPNDQTMQDEDQNDEDEEDEE